MVANGKRSRCLDMVLHQNNYSGSAGDKCGAQNGVMVL